MRAPGHAPIVDVLPVAIARDGAKSLPAEGPREARRGVCCGSVIKRRHTAVCTARLGSDGVQCGHSRVVKDHSHIVCLLQRRKKKRSGERTRSRLENVTSERKASCSVKPWCELTRWLSYHGALGQSHGPGVGCFCLVVKDRSVGLVPCRVGVSCHQFDRNVCVCVCVCVTVCVCVYVCVCVCVCCVCVRVCAPCRDSMTYSGKYHILCWKLATMPGLWWPASSRGLNLT
jgi:hypothetical protein